MSRWCAVLIRERRRLISAGQLGPESKDGAINPGGLVIDGRIHLLCRAEPSGANWFPGRLFENQATPILCVLGPDLSLDTYRALTCDGIDGGRPEDWRLFRHQEKVFTNYSVYYGGNSNPRSFAAVAELDRSGHRIVNQIVLRPHFRPHHDEKNWVMFSHRGKLLCLYSVVPYILLEIDLKRGRTKTVAEIDDPKIELGRWSSGFLSNSTNPVVWDADHYLTFVHTSLSGAERTDDNRLYLQFGMLIDRQTLRPVSVIPEPLVTGGAESGRRSGVHYTSSLVVGEDVLYAFYGEGDTHTGVTVFDKTALGDEFRRHYIG